METMPSAFHRNRNYHNWLVYDISDRFLVKNTGIYRGHLYDLGCAEQPYREWFMQYVDSYTGVDWSNTYNNHNADVVADLNKPLPINNNVADTVISLSVLEHLREPQMMLNESISNP